MKSTDSCVVTTSANVLLTFDPIQHSRLEWIRLTTNCAYRWLCEKSRTELPRAWGSLDAVLSDLAQVAIGKRRRLSFVLISTGEHKEGCISFGRKWLPELLPRFHDLGTLRLDCEPCRPHPASNGVRSRPHGSNCMKEDLSNAHGPCLRDRHTHHEQQVCLIPRKHSVEVLTNVYGAKSSRCGSCRPHERSPFDISHREARDTQEGQNEWRKGNPRNGQ